MTKKELLTKVDEIKTMDINELKNFDTVLYNAVGLDSSIKNVLREAIDEREKTLTKNTFSPIVEHSEITLD